MRFWIGFAALVSAPGLAQTIKPMPQPAADYVAMSPDELSRQLGALSDDDPVCSHAFPIMRELAKRQPQVPEIVNEAQQAELFCAHERMDFATAFRILEANAELAASIDSDFALYITSMGGSAAALPAAFERLFQDDSMSLQRLAPEVLGFALNKARETGTQEAVDKLAFDVLRRPDLSDRLDPDVRQMLSRRALDAAARAGDIASTHALLVEIKHPEDFEALLGERRYESIWPAVEARVGPSYSRVTASFLAAEMSAYGADPDADRALNDAAHALYYDGRFADVITFADRATARPDLVATMTEDEGWALNLKAYALDALGRVNEADAVFDLLAKAGGEHRSWGVSMVINRASRLVGQKRWVEGFAAAGEAKAIAADFGNDYARGLVEQAQVCALEGLGRAGEATAPLAALEAKSRQFPVNYAEALLCLGRADEAADVLIGAIADEETRPTVLSVLQPEAMDLFFTRSSLPHSRDLLATHPRLREAFLAHAREIPQAYWPAASLKR